MMRAFGDRLGSDWCVGVAGGFNCGCAWSGRIFLSALALGYSSSSKKGDQGLPWGCYPKRDKTPSKTAVAAISLGDALINSSNSRAFCLREKRREPSRVFFMHLLVGQIPKTPLNQRVKIGQSVK